MARFKCTCCCKRIEKQKQSRLINYFNFEALTLLFKRLFTFNQPICQACDKQAYQYRSTQPCFEPQQPPPTQLICRKWRKRIVTPAAPQPSDTHLSPPSTPPSPSIVTSLLSIAQQHDPAPPHSPPHSPVQRPSVGKAHSSPRPRLSFADGVTSTPLEIQARPASPSSSSALPMVQQPEAPVFAVPASRSTPTTLGKRRLPSKLLLPTGSSSKKRCADWSPRTTSPRLRQHCRAHCRRRCNKHRRRRASSDMHYLYRSQDEMFPPPPPYQSLVSGKVCAMSAAVEKYSELKALIEAAGGTVVREVAKGVDLWICEGRKRPQALPKQLVTLKSVSVATKSRKLHLHQHIAQAASQAATQLDPFRQQFNLAASLRIPILSPSSLRARVQPPPPSDHSIKVIIHDRDNRYRPLVHVLPKGLRLWPQLDNIRRPDIGRENMVSRPSLTPSEYLPCSLHLWMTNEQAEAEQAKQKARFDRRHARRAEWKLQRIRQFEQRHGRPPTLDEQVLRGCAPEVCMPPHIVNTLSLYPELALHSKPFCSVDYFERVYKVDYADCRPEVLEWFRERCRRQDLRKAAREERRRRFIDGEEQATVCSDPDIPWTSESDSDRGSGSE